MMSTATVLKCEGDIALIETLPNESPCDTCKNPCAQRNCSALKTIKLWAKNTCGAKVGEKVSFEETKTSAGIFSALCCMALPLLAAVASFILIKGHIEESFTFLISLAIFAVTEFFAVPIAKSYEKRHPTLNIVKNLENK